MNDEEDLERLFQVFQEAYDLFRERRASFVLDSPVELLLQLVVNASLILANQLQSGKLEMRKNPQLKFTDRFDSLQLPIVIKIKSKRKQFQSTEIAQFFRNLAEAATKLRRGCPDWEFMSLLALHRRQLGKSQSVYHYHRRNRRRRTSD